jgi:hypothetical protein
VKKCLFSEARSNFVFGVPYTNMNPVVGWMVESYEINNVLKNGKI